MRRLAVAGVVLAGVLAGACGKKGGPLPPLVRLPQPPAEFTATRRAGTVELRFTVPNANTDLSRPANVERVDVYGFTGSAAVSDDLLLKHGTKIGSVPVKAPRDPNAAIDPEDEGEDGAEEPEVEGPGLDQGAGVHLEEVLTAEALAPVSVLSPDRVSAAPEVRPLLGPPEAVPTRTYVGVGISKDGKKGPLSRRAAVPLVPPPPAPASPAITYDEKAVTVVWGPAQTNVPAEAPPADLLPAQLMLPPPPSIAYNVYEVPSADAASASSGTLLTKKPLSEAQLVDARVEWGVERCYVVRAVAMFDMLSLESDPSPPACRTLVDAFAPGAPKGLTVVASPGAMSLIWQPNDEKDVAGYIVFRGVAPATAMARVTPELIHESTFKDTVDPGTRYVYRVQAIDTAGNMSQPSDAVEELAR